MTVFKTFLQVVKRYKGTIILYTAILIVFGLGNMSTTDNNLNFENSKPDIFIVNEDQDSKITTNLINYLNENCNQKEIKNTEDAINDALFYRDIQYVIYLPKDFGKSILNKEEPKIEIKSTDDYKSSLASKILTRYLEVEKVYSKITNDETELIDLINTNLSKTANIEITSKLDTGKISQINYYYNFASYSVLAVIILVICLVMNSFNKETIHKRTVISSMSYRKYNREILLGSFVYSFLVWLVYSLLSIIILGNAILSVRGFIYMFNLLLYSICSLTIAILISTIVNNKNAVNGIVNVVALGSAFLCGAFIPTEWLPESILKIAHVLPAYWYINANERLGSIEVLNFENLKPLLGNYLALFIFILVFIIINNRISKIKQKN